jgi:hypothetical protein
MTVSDFIPDKIGVVRLSLPTYSRSRRISSHSIWQLDDGGRAQRDLALRCHWHVRLRRAGVFRMEEKEDRELPMTTSTGFRPRSGP